MRKPKVRKAVVWVLLIEHRYGIDMYACARKDRAHARLADFVARWWAREMPSGLPMPKDPDERIRAYFEHMDGRESYILGKVEVEP